MSMDEIVCKLERMDELQTSTITNMLMRLEILISVLKEKGIIIDQDYTRKFDELLKPENLRTVLKKYFSKDMVEHIMKGYEKGRKKV